MHKQILSLTTVLASLMIFSGAAVAATSGASSSANFSKSYVATQTIKDGTVVSLKKGQANTIEPANSTNLARMVGVAVADEDSLLAVNSGDGKVQVATSGSAAVYASDLNGAIKIGDQVSVSPLNGVAMKLSAGRILGVAQSTLNDNTVGAETQSITDKNGKSTKVHIAKIKIVIAIGASANEGQSLSKVQQFVKSITGKTIPTARIVTGIIVAAVAIIAMIALIYSSIYGALISLGRNPLARRVIYRALVYVLLMVLAVGIVATILVTGLLT